MRERERGRAGKERAREIEEQGFIPTPAFHSLHPSPCPHTHHSSPSGLHSLHTVVYTQSDVYNVYTLPTHCLYV